MSDQYPPRDPYRQQPGQSGQQPWGQPGQQPPGQYGQPGPGQPSGGRSEPPLWAPWYGIPFPQAFLRFWKKYVRFDGRASQSEYWFWALWYLIGVGGRRHHRQRVRRVAVRQRRLGRTRQPLEPRLRSRVHRVDRAPAARREPQRHVRAVLHHPAHRHPVLVDHRPDVDETPQGQQYDRPQQG
ncbi:hypothetical protein Q9Q99_06270 [Curtobacterium flaccumfaciens]|nr:hypothetical protein Q9Q99_06270 [Curtobacterium flaccumfaciens]